jgi:hypothetical protein
MDKILSAETVKPALRNIARIFNFSFSERTESAYFHRIMATANLAYFADLIRRKPWKTAVILGLFFGYLAGTAGVAVWPAFARLSSPLICEQGLRLDSEHYAMVNSESGVNRHFYCEDTPGVRKPANLKVMVATGLIYSLIFSGIFAAGFFTIRKFQAI